ncbi:acsf (predicted) [Pycnogonum litorale]
MFGHLILSTSQAECKAIVMSDGFKGTNYFGLLSNIIPDLPSRNRNDINCKEVPNLKSIITFNSEAKTSTFSFEDILNSGEEKTAKLKLESQMKIVQPDDIAFIQFTSGTTGSPKAVLLSHHMIFNNAYCIGKRLQYTSKNDRICVSVPLFHCFGNIVGTTAAVCYGISVVLPSPGFNAKATMKAIDDEKCTMLYGTPTMFIDILHNESFDNFTFNSLRGGVMAASNCPVELLKAINSKMNMKDVCVGYGTTENTAIITLSHPEDPLHIRCSSVGNTIDHVEVKVMDSNGCTVKRGEMGELCSRGYQVMQGYLNEPEKTKEVFDVDRWYKTGDLATMDDQGYIRIVGRIKDMIIRGGENIYPREIEEFLHTHPDIAEAQVFGIPDERLGEIVCSWIKLKINRTLTEEQTREFCKDNIAKFKIPKHVLFVSEFPTTQSGKIQKFKMREIMIKELASSV